MCEKRTEQVAPDAVSRAEVQRPRVAEQIEVAGRFLSPIRQAVLGLCEPFFGGLLLEADLVELVAQCWDGDCPVCRELNEPRLLIRQTPQVLAEALFGSFLRLQGGVAQDAHMRKRKTTKAGDWKLVEARLNELRMMTAFFLERATLRQEHTVPDVDMTEVSPVEAAQRTRALWRMPSGPVPTITPWLEAAGILVIVEEFPTSKIDGMSQWGKDAAVMLVNSLLPLDRRRLTMAHELGHLVMHDEVLAGDDDVESQANAFAAEFLMPAHVMRNELRSLSGATMKRTSSLLLALKGTWGVSMQALYERAYSLGIVDASHRTAFYKMMGAQRWRTREPGDEMLVPEEPRLIPSIGSALRSGGLSHLDAMKLLGTTDPNRVVPFQLHSVRTRPSHLRVVG